MGKRIRLLAIEISPGNTRGRFRKIKHGALSSTGSLGVIKQVGKTAIRPIHKSSCHCAAVEMEVDLPEGIVDPRRCNCSICRRKSAVVGSVPLSALRIVKGGNKLSLYQFDTMEAEHYFCSVCGIYTHHKRRSNPDQFGINLACLEGVDPNLIEGIKVYDGANNHPSDKPAS